MNAVFSTNRYAGFILVQHASLSGLNVELESFGLENTGTSMLLFL